MFVYPRKQSSSTWLVGRHITAKEKKSEIMQIRTKSHVQVSGDLDFKLDFEVIKSTYSKTQLESNFKVLSTWGSFKVKDLSLRVVDFFFFTTVKLGYIRHRGKIVEVLVERTDMPSIIRSSETLVYTICSVLKVLSSQNIFAYDCSSLSGVFIPEAAETFPGYKVYSNPWKLGLSWRAAL